MTDHDDRDGGGDDDPRLSSLRAVWLAMPDEDPPERGLAELMAAARVKADEMAKPATRGSDTAPAGPATAASPEDSPSWWQRLAALLRRPPMLALASVMVLVGGAVLIGQRGDKMEAEPTLTSAQDTAAPATESAAQGSARAETGGPARVEVAGSGTAEVAGSATVEATESASANAALAAPITPEPRQEKAAKPAVTGRSLAPPPKQPAKKSATSSGKGAKLDAAQDKLEDSTTLESEQVAPDGHAFESELVVGGTTADTSRAPTGTSRAPTAETSRGPTAETSRAPKYLAEAKAAAARGDCARAQAWLKRLASEDATAYRKAIASDAALKNCVVAQ